VNIGMKFVTALDFLMQPAGRQLRYTCDTGTGASLELEATDT